MESNLKSHGTKFCWAHRGECAISDFYSCNGEINGDSVCRFCRRKFNRDSYHRNKNKPRTTNVDIPLPLLITNRMAIGELAKRLKESAVESVKTSLTAVPPNTINSDSATDSFVELKRFEGGAYFILSIPRGRIEGDFLEAEFLAQLICRENFKAEGSRNG